jgi:hypothetical protein
LRFITASWHELRAHDLDSVSERPIQGDDSFVVLPRLADVKIPATALDDNAFDHNARLGLRTH